MSKIEIQMILTIYKTIIIKNDNKKKINSRVTLLQQAKNT